MPETNRPIAVVAFIVRAAMGENSRHPGEQIAIDGLTWFCVVVDSSYTAHEITKILAAPHLEGVWQNDSLDPRTFVRYLLGSHTR